MIDNKLIDFTSCDIEEINSYVESIVIPRCKTSALFKNYRKNIPSSGFGFNHVTMITLPNDDELYAVIKDNLNELKRIEDKQKI